MQEKSTDEAFAWENDLFYICLLSNKHPELLLVWHSFIMGIIASIIAYIINNSFVLFIFWHNFNVEIGVRKEITVF